MANKIQFCLIFLFLKIKSVRKLSLTYGLLFSKPSKHSAMHLYTSLLSTITCLSTHPLTHPSIIQPIAFSESRWANICYKQTGTATAKKMTCSGPLYRIKRVYITYYLQSNGWWRRMSFFSKLSSNLTKILFYVAQSIEHNWCKLHFGMLSSVKAVDVTTGSDNMRHRQN